MLKRISIRRTHILQVCVFLNLYENFRFELATFLKFIYTEEKGGKLWKNVYYWEMEQERRLWQKP